MLVWCLFNAATDYICTPVLIVTSKTNVLNAKLFCKKGGKVFSGYVCILPWKTRTPHNIQILSDSVERVINRDSEEISFIFTDFFSCKDLFQENSKACLIVWLPFHDTQPLSVTYLTAIWGKVRYMVHLKP